MTTQRPISPLSRDLFQGLQRVAQHNATTPTRRRLQGDDAGARILSPRSNYGSPALMHPSVSPQVMNPYSQQQNQSIYPDIHSFQDAGPITQYAGYGPPQSDYYPAENIAHGFQYTPDLRESTPATPKSPDSDLVRRTRSGRTLVRPNSPQGRRNDPSRTRVTKSPKVKTPKQKALAAKTPKIDKPLSELTKDMTDVPVRDIEAWVNRPASIRLKEVEKRNGYVTRPMNSFMLYRSAYAERTKAWCVQNNHQVVSSVSGESWPLESPEVREQYNEYARVERANHANAHPDYKFQPSKNGLSSSPRRRKHDDFDEEEEEEDDNDGFSDIDRSDSEYKPRGGRTMNRSTTGSGAKRQTARSPTPFSTSYTENPMQHYSQPHMHSLPQFEGGDALMGGIHHASSWGPDPSTDFYPNANFYPSTILSSSAPSGMPHAELPYYVPSTYPTNTTSYHPETLHLQYHPSTPAMPMGMQIQTPTQVPMQMQMQMQMQPPSFDNTYDHFTIPQEQQVDPMLLQMDDGTELMGFDGFGEGVGLPSAGMGMGMGMGMGTGMGMAGDTWGEGFGSAATGAHFEEWMAGREGL